MRGPFRWYCRTILMWGIAIACGSAQAQSVFEVTEPWVRPGTANHSSEVYVRLLSSAGATLIGVSSELAARVLLQSPTGKVISPLILPLPAGENVRLQAKGYRLVLHRLVRGLKSGDRVPLTLTVRNGDGTIQTIAVDAEVRLHSPTDDHRMPHTHR